MDAGKPDPRATPEALASTLLLMVIKQRKNFVFDEGYKKCRVHDTPNSKGGASLGDGGPQASPHMSRNDSSQSRIAQMWLFVKC